MRAGEAGGRALRSSATSGGRGGVLNDASRVPSDLREGVIVLRKGDVVWMTGYLQAQAWWDVDLFT